MRWLNELHSSSLLKAQYVQTEHYTYISYNIFGYDKAAAAAAFNGVVCSLIHSVFPFPLHYSISMASWDGIFTFCSALFQSCV